MSNLPVPTLPPASELRRYSSSPPDFFSPVKRYQDDESSQEYVYDSWDTPSVPEKISLLRQALNVFPFSVDALNGWAQIYELLDPPDLKKAEQTYEIALASSRLLWPDLEQQSEIAWGHIEHRPFLRACHGMAMIRSALGKTFEAVEMYRFLLRVNPNDNQGIRSLLFSSLIETGDYQLAEEISEKHGDGRKSTSTFFRYGFVIVDFLKFKLGVCSQDDLYDTLAQALECNNYVPLLLLGDIPLPGKPESISPGLLDEAASVVHSIKGAFERVAGILDWLRAQQYLDGKKPNDDGTILFELLQKGKILVKKKNPDALLEVTTSVGVLPGRGLPGFCLAPGMKQHNPAKIVAYKFRKDLQESASSQFTSFPYNDVVSVAFWKVLHSSKAFGNGKDKNFTCNVCYEPASRLCSACKVTWYCSKSCQKKDWKGRHKMMCPKFVKT